MEQLMYPTDGKETVIPIYVENDATNVKATLFPRYIGIGGQAFQSASYRLYQLKNRSLPGVIGLPKGDVNDARGELTRINPRFVAEAGAPKQVDIPDDIKELLESTRELLKKQELSDDEKEIVKNAKKKLDIYFSASRSYAI